MASDDALHKILKELQDRAVRQTKDAAATRADIQRREREAKLTELTAREVSSIPNERTDIRLYRSVGKAFVLEPKSKVESGLKSSKKELDADIVALNKKLKTLDKEIASTQTALKEIFHQQN